MKLSNMFWWLAHPIGKRRVALYKSTRSTSNYFRPDTGYRVVVKTFMLIPPFVDTWVFNLEAYGYDRSGGYDPWVSAIISNMYSSKRLRGDGWQRTSFLDFLAITGIGKGKVFEALGWWYDSDGSEFTEGR